MIRSSKVLMGLLALLLLSGCVSNGARPNPQSTGWSDTVIYRINSVELLQLMHASGYQAQLTEDGDIAWDLDGRGTYLMVFSSEESILFRASYYNRGETSVEDLNHWNKRRMFSRTYFDDDGDPVLELDLSLTGGITRARLLDFLIICTLAFDDWYEEIL